MAASFQMVLGMTFADIVLELGHAGDDFPYADGTTRRGFHVQECIDLAFKRGYAVTEIQAYYGFRPSPTSNEQIPAQELSKCVERFVGYAKDCPLGVITGELKRHDGSRIGHAVAWDGNKIYDPRGKVYTLHKAEENDFFVCSLWMVRKMELA
jgi:hypothetical protein